MVEPWGWVTKLSDWMGITPAELWSALPGLLLALAAFVGAFRFLAQRKKERDLRAEELAWRRTELISTFAERLDSDPQYKEAMLAISAAKHGLEGPDLDRILDPDVEDLAEDELVLRASMDRYFDFFDRMHTYIYVTKVLTPGELVFFSSFVEEITDVPALRRFAETMGYDVVLQLAKTLVTEREKHIPSEPFTTQADP